VTGFTSVAKLVGVSLRGGKNVAQVQAHVTAKDLELLSELIEAGKVRRRSTGAIRLPRSPQRSPTWNKATPGPRWSWEWPESPPVVRQVGERVARAPGGSGRA
jgi:hypothetical protein